MFLLIFICSALRRRCLSSIIFRRSERKSLGWKFVEWYFAAFKLFEDSERHSVSSSAPVSFADLHVFLFHVVFRASAAALYLFQLSQFHWDVIFTVECMLADAITRRSFHPIATHRNARQRWLQPCSTTDTGASAVTSVVDCYGVDGVYPHIVFQAGVLCCLPRFSIAFPSTAFGSESSEHRLSVWLFSHSSRIACRQSRDSRYSLRYLPPSPSLSVA